MHRATPLNSSFRGYVAGGARCTIDTIDDAKFMQEPTNTGGKKGEKIPRCEAPQNYGFTSVVADADKSGNPGSITDSAEGFISFMGGNRSFPVLGVMDDRRHRLRDLAKDAAKGATAMFGLKKWGQQLLNTEDGWFMTGNTEKKMRLQLVDNKNEQQQQQQDSGGGGGGGGAGTLGVSALAAGGSSGGGGGQAGQQQKKQKGQKTLHKESSSTFVDMTKNAVHTKRGNGQVISTGDRSLVFHGDENKSARADDGHAHIRNGNQIWVTKGGCFASKPIVIKADPCVGGSAWSGGAGGAGGVGVGGNGAGGAGGNGGGGGSFRSAGAPSGPPLSR